MATFAELVTASANSGLVEKIKIATLVAADNIRAESTGAGLLLYYGAISPSIVCGSGVTPQLTAGNVVTED
jgi:hypothetical protein